MPRRKRRKFTWIIFGANVLLLTGFVILVVTAYQQPCNYAALGAPGPGHHFWWKPLVARLAISEPT